MPTTASASPVLHRQSLTRQLSGQAPGLPLQGLDIDKGSLHVRAHKGKPFFEARWRDLNRVDRRKRLGQAWVVSDGDGGWCARRGRVPTGLIDERRAHRLMPAVIREHEESLRREVITAPTFEHALFDDVIDAFLDYQATEKRVKPSTLSNNRCLLAKPNGNSKQRGARIMRFFGGHELFGILTADIRKFLATMDREEISARTVNIHRQLLHAIFEYARRQETFGLTDNPVSATTKRPEDGSKSVEPFDPAEILLVANAAKAGLHRCRPGYKNSQFSIRSDQEWHLANVQDGCLYIIAVTTGLRMGELIALRWRDVDLRTGSLAVSRSMSAGKESSTKSRKPRVVPLAEQAIEAFRELRRRGHFTGLNDFVFCHFNGASLDRSAVRKRFVMAQEVAGVAVRRFHDLRHSFGSLAVHTFDIVAVKEMMGHAKVTTTERYLHSKARKSDGQKLTAAFLVGENVPELAVAA
jgi:integrase